MGNGEGATASDAREAQDRLDQLLRDSVHRQLVADVPVGVFSSGGLDSSLLVALAARERETGLHTFSVRFPDPSYDEGGFAHLVGRTFGTTQVDALADDGALVGALETVIADIAEPITDPAILPTLILARAARERVGVVLSGEGADELFGGYPTYLGHRLAPRFAALPAGVRRLLAATIRRWPPSDGKVPVEYLLKRFVAGAELPWFDRHVSWFGTGLPSDVQDGWTGRRVDGWKGDQAPPVYPSTRLPVLDSAMRWDYSTYLRDLMLPKIDRATSLVALEARAPYLDTEVTRFAHALAPGFKVRGLATKWLLRRVARRWLPGAILRRRKRGLSVPLAPLLTGPLAPLVDRVLDARRLERRGVLNPGSVRQLVVEHRRGRLELTRGLWALFVLGLWMDHWMPEGTG